MSLGTWAPDLPFIRAKVLIQNEHAPLVEKEMIPRIWIPLVAMLVEYRADLGDLGLLAGDLYHSSLPQMRE